MVKKTKKPSNLPEYNNSEFADEVRIAIEKNKQASATITNNKPLLLKAKEVLDFHDSIEGDWFIIEKKVIHVKESIRKAHKQERLSINTLFFD
jgi:hypothetical protein